MKTLARIAFRRRLSLFEMVGIAAGAVAWRDLPIAGAVCGFALAAVVNVIGSFWSEWEG